MLGALATSAIGTCIGTSSSRTGNPGERATAIAEDAIRGVEAHGDGAVVLLHTWPGGTGDAIAPMIEGLRALRRHVRVGRPSWRFYRERPAARDPGRGRRGLEGRCRCCSAGTARSWGPPACAAPNSTGTRGSRHRTSRSDISCPWASRSRRPLASGAGSRRLPVADLGVYLPGGRRPARATIGDIAMDTANGWTANDIMRNDTFAVLRAGTDRSWGVGVVCGFGTNCSAVAPTAASPGSPRSDRSPVTGEVRVSSARWLPGMRFDPRMAAAQKTILERSVPAYFGLQAPPTGDGGDLLRTDRRTALRRARTDPIQGGAWTATR